MPQRLNLNNGLTKVSLQSRVFKLQPIFKILAILKGFQTPLRDVKNDGANTRKK